MPTTLLRLQGVEAGDSYARDLVVAKLFWLFQAAVNFLEPETGVLMVQFRIENAYEEAEQ